MTSRERMKIALDHHEPDRVPYDLAGTTVTGICKGAFLNAMKERGLSTEFDLAECDPIQQLVTPVEETLVNLKSDTRRIGARRVLDYEKVRTYDENGTAILTDLYDCEWRMSTHELYYSQASYPLKKYESITEGLKHWNVPNWGPEQIAKMEFDIAPLAKQLGDFCGIADRNCAGLTEMSTRIRGHEAWYLDVYMDPEGIDALAQQILDHKKEYWASLFTWINRNNLSEKILVAAECDDLGTQTSTLIAPEDLRRFIIPKFEELFGFIKSEMPGIKTFMHSCGSIRPIIPDLIEAGLDILNPIQFTAKNMELIGLKKDFGTDLTFWGGGIDTQVTLCKGKPTDVKDEVKRILDIMAPGGGFVFAPVHNIQDDVSAENFWAMWDTLQEYGKY